MLLSVDIGNTNINLGLFKGNKLRKQLFIPTKTKNLFAQLKKIFLKSRIDDVIICSVVPKVTKALSRDIKKLSGNPPYVLGKNINAPIKNLYKNPRQVGQDRLAAAFAAAKIYGVPVIIVDFGTATTFDLVSKKGEYLGGIIFPGIGMSLDALHEKTALLPMAKLKKPKNLIGRDTLESILSGIYFGFAGLVDTIISRIFNKLGKKIKVVFTGGYAEEIGKLVKSTHQTNSCLILSGLQLIYNQSVTIRSAKKLNKS